MIFHKSKIISKDKVPRPSNKFFTRRTEIATFSELYNYISFEVEKLCPVTRNGDHSLFRSKENYEISITLNASGKKESGNAKVTNPPRRSLSARCPAVAGHQSRRPRLAAYRGLLLFSASASRIVSTGSREADTGVSRGSGFVHTRGAGSEERARSIESNAKPNATTAPFPFPSPPPPPPPLPPPSPPPRECVHAPVCKLALRGSARRPQSNRRTTCLCIAGNINIAIYARFNWPAALPPPRPSSSILATGWPA